MRCNYLPGMLAELTHLQDCLPVATVGSTEGSGARQLIRGKPCTLGPHLVELVESLEGHVVHVPRQQTWDNSND